MRSLKSTHMMTDSVAESIDCSLLMRTETSWHSLDPSHDHRHRLVNWDDDDEEDDIYFDDDEEDVDEDFDDDFDDDYFDDDDEEEKVGIDDEENE